MRARDEQNPQSCPLRPASCHVAAKKIARCVLVLCRCKVEHTKRTALFIRPALTFLSHSYLLRNISIHFIIYFDYIKRLLLIMSEKTLHMFFCVLVNKANTDAGSHFTFT